ncbi:hypothetical protein OWM54_34600 [Myxococcus sp. MISCRS1]|jgi:hypothetical protein|uniref:hypothetical protein n=1 Tax=Myxococcus TaxID=32 RepID=UPI00129C2E7F|nr:MULTISPECIES: hypothetical protein [unclassified Myxococcus]MBZ4398839.1 hypothetical protein [Myxococcus sp. AS-1-15]MBZ4407099.1 hypothetical protein [Myxococcus sp. XM-1-1-1]MCY1002296.1 hypothetical protein [Myxococcus sp. MISCRS1]BDT36132.1 hypothetical protein MFMH1_58010 [Myxococcus sp. MH1]
MRNSNSRMPGLIAHEIPDPPPERDRGLRAPTEEAPEALSARPSVPQPPASPAVNPER